MANERSEPVSARSTRTIIIAAALLALPLVAGCAQSASVKWAQNSAVIAPAERPPTLTSFSALVIDDRDDEVQ